MKVQDIMTANVACCMPDTKLNQVARMMVEHDCGEIPVTDQQGTLQGVVTDRDICCRAVAHDCNPCDMSANEIMSTPVISARPEMTIQDCAKLMEQNRIRRIPVVTENGQCCGIVSLADIACNRASETEEVLQCVSEPSRSASAVH